MDKRVYNFLTKQSNCLKANDLIRSGRVSEYEVTNILRRHGHEGLWLYLDHNEYKGIPQKNIIREEQKESLKGFGGHLKVADGRKAHEAMSNPVFVCGERLSYYPPYIDEMSLGIITPERMMHNAMLHFPVYTEKRSTSDDEYQSKSKGMKAVERGLLNES